jgi:hypothetical protein
VSLAGRVIVPVANAAAQAALLAAAGSSPATPLFVFRTDLGVALFHTGTTWRPVSPLFYGARQSADMTVSAAEVTVPGLTMTLPAGTWNVLGKGLVDWVTGTGNVRTYFRIYAGGVLQDETQAYTSLAAGNVTWGLNHPAVVLAASTVVNIVAIWGGAPGSGSIGARYGTMTATLVG